MKRTIFKKSGGFDPAIFLYHEDDDLSLRLSNEFGKLYFVHDALVMHMEGQSSERSPDIAALKAWPIIIPWAIHVFTHNSLNHFFISWSVCFTISRVVAFVRKRLTFQILNSRPQE